MPNIKRDIRGKRYGILVAIRPTEKRLRRNVVWLCECDCGNTHEAIIADLERSHVQSCGCHNHRKASLTWNHPLYSVWNNMKARCYRPTLKGYENYGGRGIKVCDRWLESFENFIEDMGRRPEGTTIDRIDNDGNYEPSNCRWATYAEQNRNYSKTKLSEDKVREIRKLLKEGVKNKTLAEEYGVTPSVISLIKHNKIWRGI